MKTDLSDILEIRYRWGSKADNGCDCYGLAKIVRSRLCPDATPLPDHDYIYELYTRKTLPPTIVLQLFDAYEQAVEIPYLENIGDIAIVLGPRGGAIVTYIGSHLTIGFGDDGKAEIMPVAALQILSCWIVN